MDAIVVVEDEDEAEGEVVASLLLLLSLLFLAFLLREETTLSADPRGVVELFTFAAAAAVELTLRKSFGERRRCWRR